jgi:hypothetical protein
MMKKPLIILAVFKEAISLKSGKMLHLITKYQLWGLEAS